MARPYSDTKQSNLVVLTLLAMIAAKFDISCEQDNREVQSRTCGAAGGHQVSSRQISTPWARALFVKQEGEGIDTRPGEFDVSCCVLL